ncbi:dihydroxy-acid dehydratase [Nakamurella sp. UYEF19]|uniref:dihydroxy-acid dehydratase n=1 Tax=Nakamurella sp. UYEF19 TaxID=1756392 RepID=UPI003391F527
MSRPLRSAGWTAGDDETALEHRVALRMGGAHVSASDSRPIIGIAHSASDLNPCNLPLAALADAAARGVTEAGGIPVIFPTISLGEDLMKPSAMLYRNLLSIEVEETLRSNPIDGVVLLTNCDKSTPGALMGAISTDLPTILAVGGNRPAPFFQGRRIGTGTDLWRMLDRRRAGEIDNATWNEFENCYACGTGSCNTLGTASTMALMAEALGFSLPSAGTVQAGSTRSVQIAEASGRRAVELVEWDLRPSRILTPAALHNAAVVLQAVAGSTNAVLHLAAIAGRAGLSFGQDMLQRIGSAVPVLTDVEPTGQYLMAELDEAGGLPTIVGVLGELIDPAVVTVTGGPLLGGASAAWGVAVRPLHDPVFPGPAIRGVRGSLAPDGAVLKAATSSPQLWRHRGPALVFSDYLQMRARLDDPDLEVDEGTVLVLRGCGPIGVPGMPEWGMVPIPQRLAERGVTDMVRVTDARMSGTSYGTVFLHAAPEAALGGPLALVRDGDPIVVDVEDGRLDLDVEASELARRRAAWVPPVSEHLRGWPALYQRHVMQAPSGCDLDFLVGDTAAKRRFVEPVIGRS